jgi:hypothetical protein
VVGTWLGGHPFELVIFAKTRFAGKDRMTSALAGACFASAQAASILVGYVLSTPNITRWRRALESPAVKRIVLIAFACVWIIPTTLCAAEATLGWPEVIGLLAKAQTQATTCVGVLKSNGDKPTLTRVELTYGMAEGEIDEVIAGLTAALVEGGAPDSLPTVRTSLETAGKGLKQICDAAVKTVSPNTKGVWEELARGAVEPLIKAISDGVGALWTRHVEKDKLEIETKKAQLEAGKWPKFSDIAAQ